MPTPPKGKYWCFTLNNYNEEEEQTLQALCIGEGQPITYLVYGREVGENGTRHLQGYVEFLNRQRLTGVKRLLGSERIHAERRRGTAVEASAYCKKDDQGAFEMGEISGVSQGRRTDLEGLKISLDEGKKLADVADDHFGSFLKYERSIRSYRNLRRQSRNWKTRVVVYWGPTGTGKTRRSMEESNGDCWIYSSDGWFDGYDGDENVIFDDFGGHEFKLTFLLKLLDRYPMRVRIKGGFTNWVPRTVYITSNYPPEDWYSGGKPEHVAALLRRLEHVEEIAHPYYDDI